MHLNLNLFLSFAKISVSAFGGGYAVMPLLQRDIVEKKNGSRPTTSPTFLPLPSVLPA